MGNKRHFAKIALFVLFSFGLVISFQNCGDIKVSGQNAELASMSAPCAHPSGEQLYASNTDLAIEFFRDSNVCSNMRERCQSAFFRCNDGVWEADAKNAEAKIELYTYKTCSKLYCQPDPPPASCPNPMPTFQCNEWGPWS